jgi:hypothetical protein
MVDEGTTCSEKGTEPSTALVVTFPATLCASVSRIMLQKEHTPKTVKLSSSVHCNIQKNKSLLQ